MTHAVELLRQQPALVVFLVIGIGYVVGRLRIGGIQLGAATGVLLSGLLLGHLGAHGSGGSQSIGFMLFIYCVGLRAGPQFFSAFRQNGGKFAILALVVAGSGYAAVMLLTRPLHLAPGFQAGLLAGAMTSTPTLVAAQDAVRDGMATLPPGVTSDQLLENISAAYAITYLVGMFGLLVLISVLPRVLRIDLKAAARRLADEGEADGALVAPAFADLPVLRVYHVTRDNWVGRPLGQMAGAQHSGFLLQRLKRAGEIVDVTQQTSVALGDLVAVLGQRPAHRRALQELGPEQTDADLLETAPQTRVILVSAATRAEHAVAATAGLGCFLLKLTRAGMALPIASTLELEKGDLIVAAGLPQRLDELARRLGRSERPADEADLVTFAFGVAAGILIGLVSVRIGGLPIGLGTAGGLLLSGLVIGFLRTLNPTFGQLPVGATVVLMELGLLFFMANVGLSAGSSVVAALASSGPGLALAAVIVMAGPVLAGFAVGRLVLGLDPVILLGALTGAMTSTPALDMVNRQADSPLPTVGYAGTYAFANVLLAVAGSLTVRL